MSRLRHEELTYQIRGAIYEARNELGIGWSEEIYHQALYSLLQGQHLVAIEIEQSGGICQEDVVIPADWRNDTSLKHRTPCLLIDNSYLLHIRALLPRPTYYDFKRVKTYLKSLGLKFGLLVNFGKNQLQIHGVRAEQ